MSRDPVDLDAKTAARRQWLSCEETESEYARAIDSLAGWIGEDIGAVASTFDVGFRKVYRDSLQRVRSQAALFARQHAGKKGARNPTR